MPESYPKKTDKLEAVSFYVESGKYTVDCPKCGRKNVNVNTERGAVNTCTFCRAQFQVGDMIHK